MKAIEIIGVMALYTLFYNLLLFFIKYRRKADVKKEQVTIEASLDGNDDIIKLKARNEFLESEIEKFATICDGLTAANKKCLDEFEAYVTAYSGTSPRLIGAFRKRFLKGMIFQKELE
jgi:hypothetical protein